MLSTAPSPLIPSLVSALLCPGVRLLDDCQEPLYPGSMAQYLVMRSFGAQGEEGNGEGGREGGRGTHPFAGCMDIWNLNIGKRGTELGRVQLIVGALGGKNLVLFLDLKEEGKEGGEEEGGGRGQEK